LETLEEIGMRERERFLSLGGQSLELVPCLNDSTPWSAAVTNLIRSASA
jgi:protoporphyrin/coproporphyrin ferrochelatase